MYVSVVGWGEGGGGGGRGRGEGEGGGGRGRGEAGRRGEGEEEEEEEEGEGGGRKGEAYEKRRMYVIICTVTSSDLIFLFSRPCGRCSNWHLQANWRHNVTRSINNQPILHRVGRRPISALCGNH